jgi:hypothetical protein
MPRRALLLCAVLLAGCFEDRSRPSPVEPQVSVMLGVQLISPRNGLTVATGTDLTVTVHARDLTGRGLVGTGYFVRQFSPGRPTLDSLAVHFTARSDSVHDFLFRVPDHLATNTQVDVYGIAYGAGGQTRVSAASSLVVVNCTNGVCR